MAGRRPPCKSRQQRPKSKTSSIIHRVYTVLLIIFLNDSDSINWCSWSVCITPIGNERTQRQHWFYCVWCLLSRNRRADPTNTSKILNSWLPNMCSALLLCESEAIATSWEYPVSVRFTDHSPVWLVQKIQSNRFICHPSDSQLEKRHMLLLRPRAPQSSSSVCIAFQML